MIGYALCGSFCTLERSLSALEGLKNAGYDILPVMSEICYSTDTRFGKAEDFRKRTEHICQREIIHTIPGAEPIGPKIKLDALIIAPCTGNTLAKIAYGITDSAVTMAAKAHVRNRKPLIIALATNDALCANLKNIGHALERKNVYLVPFGQDDFEKKPCSMIADFSRIGDTLTEALMGRQLQPLIIPQG
ncbi:MAG: dipicolinate synthase subunit B [Ruminococcaceae bacterium]|nr:dipicolinate synthase subunit B [Oscillospiraceae bacterium]